jgi:serine/threonine-protein kinase
LLHRSETLRELGNFAPAIADCDQCLKLQPDLVKAYLCRANVLRDQGRMDKAIADYDHALQLAPGSAIALVERGLARQAVGKYQQAINDYGRALAIDKGFLLAYNGLAWILATCPDAPLRDGKKAVEFATKACERGGWVHSDELDTLAAAYAERGQFDEAIKWQQKAIELASTDADKAEFQQRLSLYSRHEAFRDTPRQP